MPGERGTLEIVVSALDGVLRRASSWCGRVVGLLWGSNARGEGVACPIDAVARGLELYFDDTPAVHAP